MQLSSFLIQSASIPRSFEATMPAGMPLGLPRPSDVITSFAASLPNTPDLPFPAPKMISAANLPKGFPEIIKGMESYLPVGAPKLSESMVSGGQYRPIETPKTVQSASGGRIIGGGYRSI